MCRTPFNFNVYPKDTQVKTMLNPFKKEKIDYKISIVTPTDYKGQISLIAKKEILMAVFNKAVKKLVRNENIHVKGDPELIERFEIPERYHKLLTTYTDGLFNVVSAQFFKNCPSDKKFQLLTHFVTACWFEKDKNKNWLIKIQIAGNHVRK